jgi:hypothetical protein
MLSADVTDLARRRVAIEFRERQGMLEDEIHRIRGEMAARGTLTSGLTVNRIHKVLAHEYNIRASVAWQVLARALSARGDVIDAGCAEGLKAEVRFHLITGCEDVQRHYAQTNEIVNIGFNGTEPSDEHRERVLEKIESEIDFAVLEATRASEAGGEDVRMHFYAPVGVVQTGPGSIAAAKITFGDSERQDVLRALDGAAEALDRVAVATSSVAEAVELIADAREEAGKDSPNISRLRATLSSVASTVQTLGSAPEAYQLLKTAATHIGLYLP